MEALNILEERLASLIALAQKLKDNNVRLQADNEMLQSENANFLQENLQLISRLELREKVAVKESQEIDELYQEKKLTKSVVDNLIKSIESLVEKEDQI